MPKSKAESKKASKAKGKLKPGQVVKTSSTDHSPEMIPPSDIRPNPRNPRLKFPQRRIEALAQSIREVGMLVPVTVYEDPSETRYVLLDGERRLKAATLNNEPNVPAWVTSKPSTTADNTLRMFNIHLMRDEWGDMATTLALKDLMDETGITSETELSHLTGLKKDAIRNMKRVLTFPEDWQQRVLDEEVPFNLLVELDKAILTKKKDVKKGDVISLSERDLRDFFLKKYDEGKVTDVVDLRKVGTLIDQAASPQNPERVRERATEAIENLLTRGQSIDDAYQYGAAASVEIKQVLKDLDILPGRLTDVIGFELEAEDRERLHRALERLQSAISIVMQRLE